MLTFNQFWLFALFFVFAVFIVIAAAIWQTRPVIPDDTLPDAKTSHSTPKVKIPTHVPNSAEIRQAMATKPDPGYPAPAKKLHQLVTEETGSLTQQALNQKIEALDKQLQALNSQLQAQGIVLPKHQPATTSPTPSDNERRLQAVRAYMENKKL